MLYSGSVIVTIRFDLMQICGHIKSEGGGKPGEVICRVAEHDSVTMIVVGTRGLGSVRRTIMGSVSDYVVHHAHCPVVICRTPSKSA